MNEIISPIIGEVQSRDISSGYKKIISGTDLNFKGNNILSKEKFQLSGTDAHINRVLFWLSSKKGDYGRFYQNKGGLLYELLGKLNNTINLKEWESKIKTNFNLEFSNDLELINIELFTDVTYRKLVINMMVRDILTNQIFTISEGVES